MSKIPLSENQGNICLLTLIASKQLKKMSLHKNSIELGRGSIRYKTKLIHFYFKYKEAPLSIHHVDHPESEMSYLIIFQ